MSRYQPSSIRLIDELLDDGAKIVLRKNIQLWYMSNAIICINKKVCGQKFWYILSGLDIQLEQSKKWRSCTYKTGWRLLDMTNDVLLLPLIRPWIDTKLQPYGLVTVGKASRSESVQFLQDADTSADPWSFCVALSGPSVDWHACLYIAVLSILFTFLDSISGNLALKGF